MRYRYNRPILADGFCFRQWGCLDVRRVTSGRCGNKRSCVIYLFLYSFFFSYSLSFTHYFFLLNQFLFDVIKLCLLTKKNIYNRYWVVRKIRATKDLNLINEIKNLNLLRFNFPSKSARILRTIRYIFKLLKLLY